jgi:eukaryotic-like serine/threonine-protein kinase
VSDLHVRAGQLFEAALELESGARLEFVAQACGADAALHAQVVALLAAHDRADGILEFDAAALFNPDRAPERVGAYRVVRELGRGGMGVVYEAERDDGQFLRRVAIKLLRGGDAESLRHRVLAERQILASLDHPNIARLLDGGVTAEGRPYLVMEHVDGLPMDVYCDRMRLTVAERLHLFVLVVRAVAYAHRNLVVHRDLKPSNILVAADGTPKLLDFGVAKLLNPGIGSMGSVGRDARVNAPDLVALTPEYASPEQLRNEMVTTQSDVYSLGVLLHVLLCGRRPFNAHSSADLMAAVCETDVVSASERVGRDETLPQLGGGEYKVSAEAIARARQTTPARLARVLRGDLESIIRMALRKEPRHRYASAELLADDIQRYLEARPVVAHGRGHVYSAGKLVLRHRLTAAAVLVGVTSLLGSATASLNQASQAREAQVRADRARSEAQRVSEFVISLFEGGAPEQAMGRTITARDLVQRGVQRIDALNEEHHVQASLLAVLGEVLGSLADYNDAQLLTERALSLYEAQADDHGRARMLVQLGTMQRQRGRYRDARETMMKALDLQLRLLGPSSEELGATYHQLAAIAVYLGDTDEALQYADDAYSIHRTRHGEHHRLTLNTLLLRGVVQRRRGDRDEAERIMRTVIASRPLAMGSTHREAMEDRLQLADVLVMKGSTAEAERIYRQVLVEAPVGEPAALEPRAWARNSLARMLARRGDLASAELLLRDSYAERRSVYGEGHPRTAEAAMALGSNLVAQARLPEAEQLYQNAADIYRVALGEQHLSYHDALAQIADVYFRRGRHAQADSLLARAYALSIAAEGPSAHGLPYLLRRRGEVHVALGRYDDAEAFLTQALTNAVARGYSAGVSRSIHQSLAELYLAWGRVADAARHSALAQ